MRLYSRTGATALDDPDYGHFDADDQGAFDFPDDLSDRLHRFHIAGRAAWETDVERQSRLIEEEMERRRDPATLMAAVQQLVEAAQASTDNPPADKPAAPTKRAAKRTATKPAAD